MSLKCWETGWGCGSRDTAAHAWPIGLQGSQKLPFCMAFSWRSVDGHTLTRAGGARAQSPVAAPVCSLVSHVVDLGLQG